MLVVGMLAAALPTASVVASQSGACDEGALAQRDVENLLRDLGDLPKDGLVRKVNNCGVTFILDAQGEQVLRRLKATDALIDALAPPKSPMPGTEWKPLTDFRTMVWLPSGEFLMGSPAEESGRDADETASTVVLAKGLWLDSTEVTKEAYKKFVDARPEWQKSRVDPSKRDDSYLKDWNGNDYRPGEGKLPVVFVSWHAAAAYATWAGKRLPTEAEWEYAARAGSSTAYWWGNEFDGAHANNTAQVRAAGGPATRNPWGLYDMLGNVWEWTSSGDRPYPYRSDDGREGTEPPVSRVVRGGGVNNAARFLRAANRNSLTAAATNELAGFRCAR